MTQKVDNEWQRRTCIFCKNLYFSPFDPGYSDVTPGSEVGIYCQIKDGWDLNDFDTTAEYRAAMLQAETCKDFEQHDRVVQ